MNKFSFLIHEIRCPLTLREKTPCQAAVLPQRAQGLLGLPSAEMGLSARISLCVRVCSLYRDRSDSNPGSPPASCLALGNLVNFSETLTRYLTELSCACVSRPPWEPPRAGARTSGTCPRVLLPSCHTIWNFTLRLFLWFWKWFVFTGFQVLY